MPCPLCGEEKHEELPFEYAFEGRRLGGVRCQSCGMVFVSPQPTADEIVAMYDESYFNTEDSNHGSHGNQAYMEQAQESGETRSETAAQLDSLLNLAGQRGTFLEVGCGPGFLLHEMKKLGWDARGQELSQYAVQFAQTELGLDVRQGAVVPESFAAKTADAVFLGDVLEHLPNPMGDLETIRGWLKPGGRIAIAVPSTLSLWSAQLGFGMYRALGKKKVLHIPPYHLLEFVPLTLRRMLERAGYEVETLNVSAVPLQKMGLRGHPLENAGKVALQVVAHATSKICNRWGDRILAIAVKK